jgi:hypothetical protein
MCRVGVYTEVMRGKGDREQGEPHVRMQVDTYRPATPRPTSHQQTWGTAWGGCPFLVLEGASPWSWASSLQNSQRSKFCSLGPAAYGTLL